MFLRCWNICPAKPHELVRLGFWDFITGIKKNGGPSNGETEKLRNVIHTSLSEDAYRLACGDRLFVPQRNVSEAENFRAYRLEWLRNIVVPNPTQIDPDLLTRIDRQEFSRIAETLCRLPEGPQKRIVRQYFALSIRLEEMGRTGRVPEKPISSKTRTAFLETEGTRGKRRARAMTILGADYWSPLTPFEAYESDATGFSPHCCFFRNDRCNLAHADLKCGVTRRERWPPERIDT
jgi:hypothetical protein